MDEPQRGQKNRPAYPKGPMMLTAIETVTQADPVWESRRHNADVAAQATARESVHAASPMSNGQRQRATVTRRNVAGMEVISLRELLFCALNSSSSCFCRSAVRPAFPAASKAFMVGP
jgi:hypothetical protein